MPKITRISLTLPQELLEELDRMLKTEKYASRSESIRNALHDFLANYKWRQGLRGRQIGIIVVIYEHDVRGLTDALVDIQHASRANISAVQHVHMDRKHCLETIIVKGQAEKIRKLVDKLGALRGVKQAKLVVA
jgi:CopG family nickel-responsive transcriptional regulator